MWALRECLNEAISWDSLSLGGSAFQSLLAKNEKDQCKNSRLKGGKSSLVLSPRKLYGTFLKWKKITYIRSPLIIQALI